MSRLTSLLLLLATALPAWGEELKDPKAILARSQAAIKALKALSYKATIDTPDQKVSATVAHRMPLVLERTPFRIVVGQGRVIHDGKRIAVFNDAKTRVRYAADLEALEASPASEYLSVLSLFEDGAALSEAAKAPKLKLEGQADVGKEPCYTLSFEVGEGEETMAMRLRISRKDLLPRQLLSEMGKLTLTDLERNPKLPANAFSTEAPKGYIQKKLEKPGLKLGQVAPDWTLKTADGKPVTLSKLKGKVVLLTFWASW